MRRLAADYAYDFGRSRRFSPAIPTDARRGPTRSPARRRTTRPSARSRAVIARAAAAPRRAGAGARGGRALLADRRTVAVLTGQQAGLFGGPLFTLLKALTALKLAEQVSRDHGVPAVAVFWIDAEDHDWDEVRSCTVFDGDLGAAHASRCPRGPARDPSPVATVAPRRSIADASRRARTDCCRPPSFASRCWPSCARAYRPASAWPRRSAAGWSACSANAGWSSTTRRIRRPKPLGRPGVRARAVDARPDGEARGAGRRRSRRRAAITRRCTRRTTAWRCSVSTTARRADPPAGRPASWSANAATRRPALVAAGGRAARPGSARTCCCGRSCRTRSSRRSVTSPGRTSWPTSASCAASTSISACRCRSSIRAPRRRCSIRPALRFLTKYKLPLEALQAQDEGGAERAAQDADSRRRSKSRSPPPAPRSRAQMAARRRGASRRSIRRSKARRDRRSAAHAARSADAARQDDSGGEAARRNAAAAVHPHARARLPRRPRAGAHDRVRLVPEPVRPGARRTALDDELPLDLGRHWIVTI